jgi:predicted DCC family thiol-disulfide oxidoreductase YuxK
MSLLPEKPIVFYDGHCGLCNSAIQFLLRNDKSNRLLFAQLQGETAKKIGLDQDNIPDSLVFAENAKIYFRSTAAIKALAACGGYRKMIYVLYIFPTFLRDWVYDYIAKNRYKWFGRYDTCRIPTAEERVKFLD